MELQSIDISEKENGGRFVFITYHAKPTLRTKAPPSAGPKKEMKKKAC